VGAPPGKRARVRVAGYEAHAPRTNIGKLSYGYDEARDLYDVEHQGDFSVPDEAMAPYLCETLELTVSELAAWDWNEVVIHLGWREGKALAAWVEAQVQ